MDQLSINHVMEDPKWRSMLDEIHDHLMYVLNDRLGWQSFSSPEMSVGGGHVMIRFEKNGERMVFRVPRHGVQQLRRTMLAYRHIGHLGFMPEKIYHDGKCILESHAEGVALNPKVSDVVLAQLATQLAKMHAIPAQKYGPLDFDLQGSYADASAYYLGRTPIVLDRSEADLTPVQSDVLAAALLQVATIHIDLPAAKTFLGHGDLWRNNILVDKDRFTVIDWDRIGAYPRECDLVFLLEADLSARQRAFFLEHYGHTVNLGLLKWFAKRRTLLNRGLRLPKMVQKITDIDLI